MVKQWAAYRRNGYDGNIWRRLKLMRRRRNKYSSWRRRRPQNIGVFVADGGGSETK